MLHSSGIIAKRLQAKAGELAPADFVAYDLVLAVSKDHAKAYEVLALCPETAYWQAVREYFDYMMDELATWGVTCAKGGRNVYM